MFINPASRGFRVIPQVLTPRPYEVPMVKIQEEGTDVATRPTINFIGGTVTAADDSANNRVNVTVSTEIPSGMIMIWSGTIATIPSGWALCNGATLSKTTYPALFAAIGYTHGGSGDNFNIPDLRNNFIPGAGDIYAVGETGGDAYHNHELDASTGGPSEGDNASAGPIGVATSTHSHTVYGTASSSLGLPPYYALAWIMKL